MAAIPLTVAFVVYQVFAKDSPDQPPPKPLAEYLSVLKAGDAIVLIHGVHAIRVIEDMQCISVKQGPFLGTAYDKVVVEVRK